LSATHSGPFPSDDELRPRLHALARHLAVFEAPGFSFGEWVPARPLADGTIALGWFELSSEAATFVRDASEAGCIVPFDWPSWLGTTNGRALAADPAAVAEASAGDLVRLLTAVVRSDRFSEGSLADAYESGLLTAIARRARDLTAGSR